MEALDNSQTDLSSAWRYVPWQPIVNQDGTLAAVVNPSFTPNPNFNPTLVSPGSPFNASNTGLLYGTGTRSNVIGLHDLRQTDYNLLRVLGSAYVQLEVLKGLKLKGTLSTDWYLNTRNGESKKVSSLPVLFGFRILFPNLSTMHQFRTLILLILLGCFQQISAQDRPNILWISAEDLSPHFASYGDNTVKTPNIDRLAKEGVVYDHVYTTAGVCAPSRCAIITGNYQTRVGGHNMRTLYDTYPAKTGLPKEYSVVPPPEIRCFPEYLRVAGYYTCNNEKTDYQFTAPPTVWDESSKTASWRKRPAGKPFFAVINFTTTHESQVWARSKNPLRVDPAKVPLPPFYPDNAIVRNDVARHYSNVSELDDQVGEVLRQLEEDGLLDKTIIFFWTDHGDGLPFFKREIYHRGLHVPLIIRYPDLAQAGTRSQRLISAIDLGPSVLSLAGIPIPKQMDGQAFIGPFAAKKERQWVFAARDRMDSEYERSRSVMDKQFQYVRNFYPERPRYQNIEYRKQQPGMAEMLRLKDAGTLSGPQLLWFEPNKPAEELYDWGKDPFQLNNLAAQPQYQNTLKKLRKVMDQWLKNTQDLGAIPEKELVKQMWNGGNQAPLTSPPSIQVVGNELRISCSTPGASIAFREKGSSIWEVYTRPIPKPLKSIEAMAMRIGYVASETITFH